MAAKAAWPGWLSIFTAFGVRTADCRLPIAPNVAKMHCMKTAYTARSYRASSVRGDEKSFQALIEESDLWITCRKDVPTDLPERVMQKLRELRSSLKAWMRLQPEFGPSLVPLEVPENAPQIIKSMAAGGQRFNVGPMAAVAGAVAEVIAREFVEESPEFIVENGGDIFMFSSRPRTVALLPDPANGANIGIKLEASLFPLSICSSSSTIGHSLSFGKGELVTVLARDAAMADAAATSLCNLLKHKGNLQKIVEFAEETPEILGLFAQCGGEMGLWGEIELVVLEG